MPASVLAEVVLDYAAAKKELDDYKEWLNGNAEFSETSVVNELKTKVNLCLLIQFAAGKGHPDRYKREFNIQGAFRADLVVGSTAEKHFVQHIQPRPRFKPAARLVNRVRAWIQPGGRLDLGKK
jgi:hypothetical protein